MHANTITMRSSWENPECRVVDSEPGGGGETDVGWGGESDVGGGVDTDPAGLSISDDSSTSMNAMTEWKL